MGYISFNYYCVHCDKTTIGHLTDRENPEQFIVCECGNKAAKALSVPNICRVSYPDGYDRWKYIKEQRKLQKLERQARKSGNKDELRRIKSESAKISEISKSDKKVSNICKVSERE